MPSFNRAAPEFRITVEGTPVREDVAKYVRSITYEHSLSLADMATLVIDNPGNLWTDHRLWAHGNQLDIWIGWGPENVEYQGRVVIGKHLPSWSPNGDAVLEVRAYDASRKLMTEGSNGESFPDLTDSEIVRNIADKYGFGSDIESTRVIHNRIKKQGMSDFELLRGLANINNMEFYVDFDRDNTGEWIIHWHSALSKPQHRVYTFKYGETLSELFLDDSLLDAPVKVRVLSWDTVAGEFIEQEIEELVVGEDPRLNVNSFNNATEIQLELDSHTKLKLALGDDKSIEVITDRQIRSDADALAFANAWFRKRKDSFLIGTGITIGVELLRPRQSHTLSGIGNRYSGNYYFTTVKQVIDSSGFRSEFVANKVLQ